MHLHVFCADFDYKLKEVSLVHHYDLFLPNCGCHDFADVIFKEKASVCFFAFELFFYT